MDISIDEKTFVSPVIEEEYSDVMDISSEDDTTSVSPDIEEEESSDVMDNDIYLDNIAAFGIIAQNKIYNNIDNAIFSNFLTVSEELLIDVNILVNRLSDYDKLMGIDKNLVIKYLYNTFLNEYIDYALNPNMDFPDFIIPTQNDVDEYFSLLSENIIKSKKLKIKDPLKKIKSKKIKKRITDTSIRKQLFKSLRAGNRKKISKRKKHSKKNKNKTKYKSRRKIKQKGGFICNIREDVTENNFLTHLRNALENGFEPKHDFTKNNKKTPFPLNNIYIEKLFENENILESIGYLNLTEIWEKKTNFEPLVFKNMINNNKLYPKIGAHKNQLYTWIGKPKETEGHLHWINYNFQTTEALVKDQINEDILYGVIIDNRFANTNKDFVFLDGFDHVYINSFTTLIKNMLDNKNINVKHFLTKIWDPIGSKYNITNYTDNTNYRELFNNAFREETRGLIHIDYNVSNMNVDTDKALKITVKDNPPIIRNNGFSINVILRAIEYVRNNNKDAFKKIPNKNNIKKKDKKDIITLINYLYEEIGPDYNKIIKILLDLKKTGDWGQVCSARHMFITDKDQQGLNPNIILITNDTLAALAAISDGVSLLFGSTFNGIKCLGLFNGDQSVTMRTLGTWVHRQFQYTYGTYGLDTGNSYNIMFYIYTKIKELHQLFEEDFFRNLILLNSIIEDYNKLSSLYNIDSTFDINDLPNGGELIEIFKNLLDKMNAYYYIYKEPTTIPHIIWKINNNISELTQSWVLIINEISKAKKIPEKKTLFHNIKKLINSIRKRSRRRKGTTTFFNKSWKYQKLLEIIKLKIKNERNVINNILSSIILSERDLKPNIKQDIDSLINIGLTITNEKEITNDNIKYLIEHPPNIVRTVDLTDELKRIQKDIESLFSRGASKYERIFNKDFPLKDDINDRLDKIKEFVRILYK